MYMEIDDAINWSSNSSVASTNQSAGTGAIVGTFALIGLSLTSSYLVLIAMGSCVNANEWM